MNLEQQLQNARELVMKFDKVQLTINSLTIYDLGGGELGGYAATFLFENELVSDEFEYWFEAAETFPRTGRSSNPAEAVQMAITKTEAELAAHVKKHYRYSNPFLDNEFVRSI